MGSGDGMFAFSTSNSSAPQANIAQLHAGIARLTAFVGDANSGDDPRPTYGSMVLAVLPIVSDLEFNPALRSGMVTKAMIEDPNNWVTPHPIQTFRRPTSPGVLI
ncbi:MAG: hypothetical protein R3B47_13280 [Bacteroidia bacterium]